MRTKLVQAEIWGLDLLKWRSFVCPFLITILPVSLLGDSGAAVLRHSGNVLVNGTLAPPSSALFSGDTVEIQGKTPARIELPGSTVDISPDTLVRFDSEELRLEHGSVSVNTSRSFRVRAGCVVVTPAIEEWTLYDVTDTDGKVIVAAHKKDVNFDSRSANAHEARKVSSGTVTVHEGEQKSREEKCGAAAVESANRAAIGGILDSPYVKWSVLGGLSVIVCLAFCHDDDPMSPAKPK